MLIEWLNRYGERSSEWRQEYDHFKQLRRFSFVMVVFSGAAAIRVFHERIEEPSVAISGAVIAPYIWVLFALNLVLAHVLFAASIFWPSKDKLARGARWRQVVLGVAFVSGWPAWLM